MAKVRAGAGSIVFLVLAPGVMAGLLPWLLTGWGAHDWPLPIRLIGLGVGVAGLVTLLGAFGRFVFEGIGTPAPVAPTERLVIGGEYRFVRNPMYLAVAAVIVGQGLVLGQATLFLYAAGFLGVTAAFVHGYEEPTLARRYGEQYEHYRRAVPAWLPRTTPWKPPREPPAANRCCRPSRAE